MKYSIEELIEWFLKYRRWSTGDPIDRIGQCDFENEFAELLFYIKNNEQK